MFWLEVRTLDGFPAFYGTQKFNTEFTRALHLFLSWARPIQSTSPQPTSTRSILILSTHLRLGLPNRLLPSGFPTNNLFVPLLPHSCYMPRPSHYPRLDHSDDTWWRVQEYNSSLRSFLHSPVTSSLFGPNILFSTLFSNTPSLCFFLHIKTKFHTRAEQQSKL
jgi:hypothetical protein